MFTTELSTEMKVQLWMIRFNAGGSSTTTPELGSPPDKKYQELIGKMTPMFFVLLLYSSFFS
jgi:hypothetical protein